MAKIKTHFVCGECGYENLRWLGRCPSCGSYSSMEEVAVEEKKTGAASRTSSGTSSGAISTLKNIKGNAENRMRTEISELDRVLNGGIVEGSLVLVGGDPGIGKSTLLLQICEKIGEQGRRILYVSGEESVRQIKMRAERLGASTDNLYLLAETNMEIIADAVKRVKPALLIIDSIQTVYREELTSVPGSVTQVRECASALMRIGKSLNISVIIVGHVTKEGTLAGPRILEHMVDTVLYFEGERQESYRIIRSVKNRFGATNEIALFEMKEEGLKEILNPSEHMLEGRPIDVPGTAITCCMEGTRPIMTEIQALISYTTFNMPRRMAAGMDYNRVIMLMAVLEKRAGLKLSSYDSYVNIIGGMKITETAVDAAVVTAIASSFRNKKADPYTLIFGEIGLTGEMRAVNMAEKRIFEANKLGFKQCVLPQANLRGLRKPEGMRVLGAANILELLEVVIS